MANIRQIQRALDMLTEGGAAPVLQGLRESAESLRLESRLWTSGKGIQGLGIAEKITDREVRKDLALKVYVERKLPKSECKNLVPSRVQIPGIDEMIETDVEEIGRVRKESNTGRVRPAIPGYGVGHPKVTVGTFGCLVRKVGSRNLYILSNSHVLANEGAAKAGDTTLQPGKFDGGRLPADIIGKLDSWKPFVFSTTGFPNTIDAAIAAVKKSHVTSKIRKIGTPTGTSTRLRRGMQVQKTGRTTDYTIGEIRDLNYRLALTYKRPSGRGTGRVGLKDQVLCTRFTEGGDSGSAVCSMTGKVVGLHFAGSPSSSIFNKIGNVMSGLGIEIVTDEF